MTTPTHHTDIATLVTRLEEPGSLTNQQITGWFVELLMAGARCPGFWSGELVPPREPGQLHWKLVQRFATSQDVANWQKSEKRQALLQSFQSEAQPTPQLRDELFDEKSDREHVTTVIVTDIKKGAEDQYFAWLTKIQSVQASFPGFAGSYFQPPPPGVQGKWSTVLRFDNVESLDNWFDSGQRQALLRESEHFVADVRYHVMPSAFLGWVPTDEETGLPPPNWKTACMVLLALLPVISLELRFLKPLEHHWPAGLDVLLNTVVSVVATTWLVMPALISTFKWWLFPVRDAPPGSDRVGLIIVALMLATETVLVHFLLGH